VDGKKASRRSIRTGLAIIVILSAAAILLLVFLTMNRKTWTTLGRMNPIFLVVAMLLVVSKWLMLTYRSRLLVRASGSHLSYGKIAKSVLGGSFVGSVTPFRAAGIPTEIYFLHEYGLPGAQASAVVASGAALSILVFTLSLPVVFILSASKIHVSLGMRSLLIAAGILAAFVFLVIAYSMKNPERVSKRVETSSPAWLKRRKWYIRWVEAFFHSLGDFSMSLRTIIGSRRSYLYGSIALTLVAWLSEFFIAPVILWGLGYPGLFWKAALAQMVVTALLPFVPIPGAAGAAEAAFATVFVAFVPASLVGFVTLAWRFFDFYMVLFGLGIGFILAVRDVGRLSRAEGDEEDPEEQGEPVRAGI